MKKIKFIDPIINRQLVLKYTIHDFPLEDLKEFELAKIYDMDILSTTGLNLLLIYLYEKYGNITWGPSNGSYEFSMAHRLSFIKDSYHPRTKAFFDKLLSRTF